MAYQISSIERLQGQLEALKDKEAELLAAGDYLEKCWLEPSAAGGTARGKGRLQPRYWTLRSRVPQFEGRCSRYVKKEDVARVRGAIERGRQLVKLRQQIGQVEEEWATLVAQLNALGLEVPKRKTHQTLLSSESNEWYTPSRFIDLVREVMGGIDLDPASNQTAQQWIQATTWYGIEDDGFERDWHGRMWLNPPYGAKGKGNHGAGAWVERAIAQYDLGHLQQAILLVRGDSKGVKEARRRFSCCEPDERIAFIREDGSPSSSPVPGCRFFYLGQHVETFRRVFSQVGIVTVPCGVFENPKDREAS